MEPICNSILFLPCFVSLFWAVTLLCSRKTNLRPQNIWIVCMLAMFFSSFIWGILLSGVEDYSLYYKLDVIDIVLTLQFFPLVYFYFRSLTNSKKFTWRQYICLAPGFVLGAIAALIYALMGDELSSSYVRETIVNSSDPHFEAGSLPWLSFLIGWYIFNVVLFLQVVVVMVYSTINLIRYKKGLSNFFSCLDEKCIENNQLVLTALFIILGFGLVVITLWNTNVYWYFNSKYIIMLVTGVIFFFMSYHVSRVSFTAQSIAPETDEKPVSPTELNEACIKLLPRFRDAIEKDKIFLRPNLSLVDVAQLLNTNRTYISHIINTEFGCNFNDYINRQRIEFAKTLVNKKPGSPQEEISQMSGFNYTTTFSRVFKLYAGVSFREWQKNAKMNSE